MMKASLTENSEWFDDIYEGVCNDLGFEPGEISKTEAFKYVLCESEFQEDEASSSDLPHDPGHEVGEANPVSLSRWFNLHVRVYKHDRKWTANCAVTNLIVTLSGGDKTEEKRQKEEKKEDDDGEDEHSKSVTTMYKENKQSTKVVAKCLQDSELQYDGRMLTSCAFPYINLLVRSIRARGNPVESGKWQANWAAGGRERT